MASKKRTASGKKISYKSHSKTRNAGMSSLQKRAFFTFTLFAFMVFGLTQVTVTSAIDTHSSVLGDEDKRAEEKKEEKLEVKREEKREDRKPEFKIKSNQTVPPLPREIEKKEPLNKPLRNVPPDINLRNNQRVIEEGKRLDQRDMEKHEVEIPTQDGQKIRTKVEDDGSKKIEIEGKDFKLKYELRNGKFKPHAENENGEIVDIPEDASEQLEETLKEDLKNEGIEVDSSTDQPTIVKDGIKAKSEFPIAIDPLTKVLTVTTPDGEKKITILPDEAIRNLKESGAVDQLDNDGGKSPEGSSEIVTYKNKMAYKIKGKKRHKMLGFIPVNTNVTSYVSAETGEPLDKEQSILSSIIDSISF